MEDKKMSNLRGYQCHKSKLANLDKPFGSNTIRQAVYCSYPDKSYIIGYSQSNTIIVAEFSFNDENPHEIQVNSSIINEYSLNFDGLITNYSPTITPLKKEKSFLIILKSKKRELQKIDIETGNMIWNREVETEYIVEDDRGVLFFIDIKSGNLKLMDSKCGNILQSIKLKNGGVKMYHIIGFDVNGDLIGGGYGSKYFLRVLTRNGKFVKSAKYGNFNFETKIDPYNNLTYLYSSTWSNITRFDPDGKIYEIFQYYGAKAILGFSFLQDCKYVMIFYADNLEIYN